MDEVEAQSLIGRTIVGCRNGIGRYEYDTVYFLLDDGREFALSGDEFERWWSIEEAAWGGTE